MSSFRRRQIVSTTLVHSAQLPVDATAQSVEGAAESPAARAVEKEVDGEVRVVEQLGDVLTERQVPGQRVRRVAQIVEDGVHAQHVTGHVEHEKDARDREERARHAQLRAASDGVVRRVAAAADQTAQLETGAGEARRR